MRLLYLDGINFIAILREIRPLYVLRIRATWILGVRRYQEIPCFPKDNGNGETKKGEKNELYQTMSEERKYE